jgi:hypothetical protein
MQEMLRGCSTNIPDTVPVTSPVQILSPRSLPFEHTSALMESLLIKPSIVKGSLNPNVEERSTWDLASVHAVEEPEVNCGE